MRSANTVMTSIATTMSPLAAPMGFRRTNHHSARPMLSVRFGTGRRATAGPLWSAGSTCARASPATHILLHTPSGGFAAAILPGGGRTSASRKARAVRRKGDGVPLRALIADPRVEHGVQRVDPEVDEHDEGDDDEVNALNHRIVALVDRVEEEAAHA